MSIRKQLSHLVLLILGGLITISLSACGLNKDSREWIEKNRVSDIYKVYPTKNPEDLFKVFPDGFGIRQSYTGKDGVTYELDVLGNPDTKEIKGELVKDPVEENKKVSDVVEKDGHLVFSDPNVKEYWPSDTFLFQHWSLDQDYIDKLTNIDYYYNYIEGVGFSIEYKLADSTIDHFLNLQNEKVTKFEISGSERNFGERKFSADRTLSFEFNNNVHFFEAIHQYSKNREYKDSREWIEENRVADMYKIYPTENPEDLFKVFPNGFGIRQSYTGKDGVTYELNVKGNPDTKEIKGALVRNPDIGNKKVSDVSVEGEHYIFSDSKAKTYWPIDSFLFQHWGLNQDYIDKLPSINANYSDNADKYSFSIEYRLTDLAIANFLNIKDEIIINPEIAKLLNREDEQTICFKITGSNSHFENKEKSVKRRLEFEFSNNIQFSETIHQYSKKE
ncbi:hypothetical protein ABZ559_01775 [Streptococcus sp. ZY19097]|uniref:hypothetical protein n=1 Tax=Streptococcus sp. ZY19097 TaxID=3231906 RepID=UPI003457C4A4